MGRIVKVDTASVDIYSEKIQRSTQEIDGALDNIKRLTEDMHKFFDTPTGKKVQETMLEFINTVKTENNSLLEYGERLAKANALYKNNINKVKQSIG